MNLIFVSILLTVSAGVLSESVKDNYSLEEAEILFENFITKHGKVYKSKEEKLKRLEIFKENLLEIIRKNADPDDTAYYGITKFTDMTQTEFRATLFGLKFPSQDFQSSCRPITLASSNFSQAPDEFDWRSQNKVSEVKNQGGCGSCWAFSSTGHLESAYAIKHNRMMLLSEQQLVDCATKCQGCNGGFMSDAFSYVVDQGLMSGQAYPYEAVDGQCRGQQSQSAIQVTGCNTYDLGDEERLKELLFKKGPISIVVAANSWGDYRGGIFQNCDQDLNHAVLLVGYGTENGTPFWLLKNSWGIDTWGDQGYMKLLRGRNTCGLVNPYMATADVA